MIKFLIILLTILFYIHYGNNIYIKSFNGTQLIKLRLPIWYYIILFLSCLSLSYWTILFSLLIFVTTLQLGGIIYYNTKFDIIKDFKDFFDF